MSVTDTEVRSRAAGLGERSRAIVIDPTGRLLPLIGATDALTVSGVATVEAACDAVEGCRPDLLMIAEDRPACALAALHALRARRDAPPVLVLAERPDEDGLVDAIVGGAAGYLARNLSLDGLFEAASAVAVGGVALDPWGAGALLRRFGGGSLEERSGILTRAERAALAALAARPEGIGYPCGLAQAALAARACGRIRDAAFAVA